MPRGAGAGGRNRGQTAGRLCCSGVHQAFSALAHLKKTTFPGSRGNSETDSEWPKARWSSIMASPAGAALIRLGGWGLGVASVPLVGGRWLVAGSADHFTLHMSSPSVT